MGMDKCCSGVLLGEFCLVRRLKRAFKWFGIGNGSSCMWVQALKAYQRLQCLLPRPSPHFLPQALHSSVGMWLLMGAVDSGFVPC